MGREEEVLFVQYLLKVYLTFTRQRRFSLDYMQTVTVATQLSSQRFKRLLVLWSTRKKAKEAGKT